MPLNHDRAEVHELEARLAEAREQQAATSEILRVISQSPADVQPVFDTIVAAAMKLCHAISANFFTFDGKMVHLAALVNATPEGAEEIRRLWPRPIGRDTAATRAIMTCLPVTIPDVLSDPEFKSSASAVAGNFRSIIAVPLVRDNHPIGAIAVGRPESGPFPGEQLTLLQTFAAQAVIAIENVRLFNETKEALERQTSTSEILRVISRSPTDVQPVFESIARAALELCRAGSGNVFTFDGELVHLAAAVNRNSAYVGALERFYPRPPSRVTGVLRAILTRSVVEIPDVLEDGDYAAELGSATGGFRSILAVPLLREDNAIGGIAVGRDEPGRFPDRQVQLLQTFAEQAVIAIENVRLFNKTQEALEQQVATSDILRVISTSPNDVQPVFDSIAANALRLCDGRFSAIYRFDGELIHIAAFHNINPEGAAAFRDAYPCAPSRGGNTQRAILTRSVVHMPDVLKDPEYVYQEAATKANYRSALSVPMLRDGQPVGAISVFRTAARPFPDSQIGLLKTFAEQAVIAIENVRLFNETKEGLERQTATSEILRVISQSPTDAQPVFDAIVAAAMKLCRSPSVNVFTYDGGLIHLKALVNVNPDYPAAIHPLFPRPPGRETVVGRVILTRSVVVIPDVLEDRDYGIGAVTMMGGFRSLLGVPLLREQKPVGAIIVGGRDPGGFPEKQISLLQIFADQAVIAIENTRLFTELADRSAALTRSVSELKALGEVGQAVSSTLELETVLQTIVARAVELTGLDGGSIYEYDEEAEEFSLQAAENMPQDIADDIRKSPTRKGDGALGRTAVTLEPTQVPDTVDDDYRSIRKELLIRADYRALLAVPLLRENHLLGGLLVNRKTPGSFPQETVDLLKTFATQSALAIQNARLFREIADKGRQLETASRHKSDFLASMSHELRTPLNAILGFNEMILGEIYGEVPAGIKEPLEDIQTSGKHLLRLINNVLDLAKIEAGRMELALADYSVQDLVESVRATLRPLATDKGVDLVACVPADLPLAYGDPGRITQCLMNLAGNSLKFTKTGKVEFSVVTRGPLLIYSVADTGIGIPPDKLESVFAEFKQTDATIASEYGGTGLGLSISRKFVEMHGGRIWAESEVGKGSTFTFEIPLRVAQAVAA